MAARPVPFLSSSPRPLTAISLLAAVLVGTAMAVNQLAGLSLLVALCYVPLVLINLPVAIALWVPFVFLDELPAPLPIGAAAGSLIVVAWLGTVRERASWVRHFVATNRRLLALLGLLLVWIALSAIWADDLELFGSGIGRWSVAALLFVIVTTTISSARHARLLAGAFVVGAVLSVAIGLAETPSLTEATDRRGRLYGGSGDPNYSAAGYLAGIIMAGGLLGGTRRPELRFLLMAAMVVLAAGLAATESRGALIGAGAATVAALVLYKGRRAQVLAVVGTAFSIAALIFSVSPSAWERVTSVENDEPRSELWLVAWRMAEDHPLTGVGLDNFTAEASGYVQQPGSLEWVELIAEKPLVVHNSFLQLLVDTGPLGLILYVSLVVACLRAALIAAKRFEAQDLDALAGFSRATAVAIIAMVSVSVFLSNAEDRRTWLLLALAPALLAIATRARGKGLVSTSTP